MVNGVSHITEVAHGVHLPQPDHLLVVLGGGEVNMANIEALVPSTTDLARILTGQAAHDLGHPEPVVGGHHGVQLKGNGGLRPTGH